MNLRVAGMGSCALPCWKVVQMKEQQIKKALILSQHLAAHELRQTLQKHVEKTPVSSVHGLDAPVSGPGHHL